VIDTNKITKKYMTADIGPKTIENIFKSSKMQDLFYGYNQSEFTDIIAPKYSLLPSLMIRYQ